MFIINPFDHSIISQNSIFDQSPTYTGPKFFGKYRGIVTNNNDPKSKARIKVRIPSIHGDDDSDWALPCYPTGYNILNNLPTIGDVVWIEFEQGNPDFPIWVGTWL